jgi:cyclopropane fatty-acyl-phospholipid synthase-like methyltransferase
MSVKKILNHPYGGPIPTLPPQPDHKGKQGLSNTGLLLSLVAPPVGIVAAIKYLPKVRDAASVLFPFLKKWELPWWSSVPIAACTLLPSFGTFMYLSSRWQNAFQQGDPHKHWTFKDEAVSRRWKGRCIPMEELHELYFDGKIEPKEDLLATLHHREEYACYTFGWRHVKFFVTQWIPEVLIHSRKQDEHQVRDHYDRGDDFYNSFLNDVMVYTSGIIAEDSEFDNIAKLQERKLDLVCDKILLKRGEKMLDIGCGWGTLSVHAAKRGAHVTGVTLGRNQKKWGMDKAAEAKVHDNVDIRCIDYRDIPEELRFNKITCLEMAEHVGVRLFPKFMSQVYNMLEDDGIFFLQIAGLRQSWQYEDLIWGLFMAKYVFPGADASCPLWWVVHKMEDAGFEVQSVDNIGVHYSQTIKLWYDHWRRNEQAMSSKYSSRWYRIWCFFLAYSSIIASQGSATCYQIVAHKNLNSVNRKRYLSRRVVA